ncbi:uncharacterized protein [Halyomorpha halys]|uniref:uncharacterized protein n=1 Tax=Halyomorpha halys TaxID=286706 RepID=UPI0006D4E0B4|nr:uncharacterized protein LOC106677785 [Halyomorpha halys]
MLDDLLFSSGSSEEEQFDNNTNHNIVEENIVHRRKTYRVRNNFIFETNERFRMSSSKIEELLLEIGPQLADPIARKGGALSAKQILCIALNWLGSGSQYHTIGDMHGVSKATVCRCIKQVVNTINSLLIQKVVSWPDDIGAVITSFYNVARFPM